MKMRFRKSDEDIYISMLPDIAQHETIKIKRMRSIVIHASFKLIIIIISSRRTGFHDVGLR